MTKVFGYARVSTTDQDLTVQTDALKKAGAQVVFAEKVSGTSRDGRTELEKVLAVLGAGDTLAVVRLDRLGRSLRDLANIADEITKAGAHLQVTEQAVNTGTPAGRAFFGMLATFAAFETDVRRERQAEGIAAAKSKGDVYTGRKPSIDRARVLALKAGGVGPSAIAKELGVSRQSVYRIVGEKRMSTVP